MAPPASPQRPSAAVECAPRISCSILDQCSFTPPRPLPRAQRQAINTGRMESKRRKQDRQRRAERSSRSRGGYSIEQEANTGRRAMLGQAAPSASHHVHAQHLRRGLAHAAQNLLLAQPHVRFVAVAAAEAPAGRRQAGASGSAPQVWRAAQPQQAALPSTSLLAQPTRTLLPTHHPPTRCYRPPPAHLSAPAAPPLGYCASTPPPSRGLQWSRHQLLTQQQTGDRWQ